MPDLIPVASYPTSAEAELARGLLVGGGLEAQLDGSAISDVAGFIGTALGGVRILVRAEDAERASEVLEEAATASTTPAWDCPACGAEVDAGYDICWSCGRLHSDAASIERAGDDTPGEMERHAECAPVERIPPGSEVEPCPHCGEDIPVDSEHCPACGEPLQESPAEDALRRAWRAALIGIVLLPGVLHLYSIYQLHRYFSLCDEEGRDSDARVWAALVIDLGALFVLIWFFRFLR
jgi:hypothetical protein